MNMVYIYYNKTPKAHQSKVKSWPVPSIISGASLSVIKFLHKYSGVPQNEFGSASSPFLTLARPKSASIIYPSAPSNTFSGFKSLYITFELCRYPRAIAIYAI